MFAGFVDLEGTLVAPILTVNTLDVPNDADSAPTYDIYNADMSSKLVDDATSTSLSGEMGVYYISEAITAAKGFAAGTTFAIVVTYQSSSANRRQLLTFTVT